MTTDGILLLGTLADALLLAGVLRLCWRDAADADHREATLDP